MYDMHRVVTARITDINILPLFRYVLCIGVLDLQDGRLVGRCHCLTANNEPDLLHLDMCALGVCGRRHLCRLRKYRYIR